MIKSIPVSKTGFNNIVSLLRIFPGSIRVEVINEGSDIPEAFKEFQGKEFIVEKISIPAGKEWDGSEFKVKIVGKESIVLPVTIIENFIYESNK